MKWKLLVVMLLGGMLMGCERQEVEIHGNEVTLTSGNFDSVVLESDRPVLVDFWAPWCGPCLRIAPTVAQASLDYEGELLVGKVNIDEQPELKQRFGITGIPHFSFFHNGEEVDRLIGANPSRLELKIRELLAKAKSASPPKPPGVPETDDSE